MRIFLVDILTFHGFFWREVRYSQAKMAPNSGASPARMKIAFWRELIIGRTSLGRENLPRKRISDSHLDQAEFFNAIDVRRSLLIASRAAALTLGVVGPQPQGRASRIMLNGVSVALRTLLNPPSVIADESFA